VAGGANVQSFNGLLGTADTVTTDTLPAEVSTTLDTVTIPPAPITTVGTPGTAGITSTMACTAALSVLVPNGFVAAVVNSYSTPFTNGDTTQPDAGGVTVQVTVACPVADAVTVYEEAGAPEVDGLTLTVA
jgi:hypothetical protein